MKSKRRISFGMQKLGHDRHLLHPLIFKDNGLLIGREDMREGIIYVLSSYDAMTNVFEGPGLICFML